MQAIDVANFTPLKPPPKVTSKRTQTGFRESGLRGLDVVSSEPGENARQTAPLDWFKTYSNGGAMNKDAKIGYNKIYRRVR